MKLTRTDILGELVLAYQQDNLPDPPSSDFGAQALSQGYRPIVKIEDEGARQLFRVAYMAVRQGNKRLTNAAILLFWEAVAPVIEGKGTEGNGTEVVDDWTVYHKPHGGIPRSLVEMAAKKEAEKFFATPVLRVKKGIS